MKVCRAWVISGLFLKIYFQFVNKYAIIVYLRHRKERKEEKESKETESHKEKAHFTLLGIVPRVGALFCGYFCQWIYGGVVWHIVWQ